MAEDVRAERVGRVLRLTLARPAARNALTDGMVAALGRHVGAVAGDPAVRVVVLRGEGGRAFAAGADVTAYQRLAAGEDGLDHERRLEAVLDAIERLPQPVLAAVDGFAVGAGLALAAACDLRVCTTAARFGLPAVRTLGNAPGMGTVARLAALAGAGRARELLLTGRLVGADEALAIGLATEVVEPGRLELRVNQLSEQLAAQAPVAMAVAKEAVRRVTVEGRRDGDDLVVTAYGSEDFREGVRALDERRAPRWQGR